MPGLSFSPATPDDHPWLFDLHEAAHRDLVERAYGPWDEEQQRALFRPLVEDHDVVVLAEAGTPVGAVYLGVEAGDTWVELIEVLPERQGHGLGSEALAWVVRHAAERNRGTLLQVHKVNVRARRLYARLGFVQVGETDTHHRLRRA